MGGEADGDWCVRGECGDGVCVVAVAGGEGEATCGGPCCAGDLAGEVGDPHGVLFLLVSCFWCEWVGCGFGYVQLYMCFIFVCILRVVGVACGVVLVGGFFGFIVVGWLLLNNGSRVRGRIPGRMLLLLSLLVVGRLPRHCMGLMCRGGRRLWARGAPRRQAGGTNCCVRCLLLWWRGR